MGRVRGGTHGEGGAGAAHSVCQCRNHRGLGREGKYKQIEKPIPTPGKFDPLNLTFVHPSKDPSSPLPLPPHGRELGWKSVGGMAGKGAWRKVFIETVDLIVFATCVFSPQAGGDFS